MMLMQLSGDELTAPTAGSYLTVKLPHQPGTHCMIKSCKVQGKWQQ